ncbi:Trypsin-like peptidase domain-containing protein [Williamsia sterculiae]|uniref:Trypsin-like peptidase domain-containing protein n=2 Tax=Williamsia sterculiae TaxID=1344003 RepID=A0A1N7DL12_9NOCA|nr:Trypsin-like peptidase domain-containing protein [Williamsia sterculiae]
MFLAVVVGASLVGGSASTPQPSVLADRRVGPLFIGTSDEHDCTATVIHSRTGDLLLTAAHCVTGAADDIRFAPGYHDRIKPYGIWRVTAVYLASSWVRGLNVDDDFAVMRVAPDPGSPQHPLETVTGRGFTVGSTTPGSRVRVVGYGGVADDPVGCRGRTRTVRGVPTISCRGLVDGTSGSPWIAGRSAIGIVGGYHQGGCITDVSHSPVFGSDLHEVIARAEAHGPSDVAPEPQSDC